MKLIIGLGNPGEKYSMTRHNAGFLCADFLREQFGFEAFTSDKKASAELSSGMIGSEKVILMKPETFMNESGRAVRALVDFYQLPVSNIAVIHDDLDIAPGTLRTTDSSRAAGHNGVQDIIDTLGTQDFFRIRLGIGHPTEVLGACMPSHDYVLQKFSAEEFAKLDPLFAEAKDAVIAWLSKK